MPGDNVRLRLRGIEEEDVRVGFVLCHPNSLARPVRVFDVKMSILEHKSIICSGYSAVMHIHSAVEEVIHFQFHQLLLFSLYMPQFTIHSLLAVVDKKGGVVQKKPQFVKPGQSVIARIRMHQPIIVEPFKDFAQVIYP